MKANKFIFVFLLLSMAQMIVSSEVRSLRENLGKFQMMTFTDKGLHADSSDIDMSKILLDDVRYAFKGPMKMSCSLYHPLLDEILCRNEIECRKAINYLHGFCSSK